MPKGRPRNDARRRDNDAALAAWLKSAGYSERQIDRRLGWYHGKASGLLRRRGIHGGRRKVEK